jgi:hypothetical protein
MRLSTRLWKLTKDILNVSVTLASDAIEGWALNETRDGLLERLRSTAERGAELALENARLEDEIDALRFNGPTLWKDEVEALNLARRAPGSSGYSNTISKLLDRCDHMPMTSGELDDQVKGILDGTVKTYDWDDIGRDIDIAMPPEHDNPPPGYAKCTRPAPHTGPCAHPFDDDPYEGSWREAADNEGARLARDGSDE